MTSATRTWREPAPVRGALAGMDLSDAGVWTGRLRSDRARAARNQTAELAAITAAIEARSRDGGARAVILSGSTARGRRTRVSDLDYHVIGPRPTIAHVAEDVDLYCDDTETLMAKLRSGDDFVHWSVWYGCILFDDGVVQSAARYLARHDCWPDANRKLRQAQSALTFTHRIVESGDHEAALEQVAGSCPSRPAGCSSLTMSSRCRETSSPTRCWTWAASIWRRRCIAASTAIRSSTSLRLECGSSST